MSRLKPAHEAFCQAYVLTSNATSAARDAGYGVEYAGQQGYRLLRRPPVVRRIAELRAEFVERECLSPAALLTKLESAFRAAMKHDQPTAAARIIETQAKIAALLAKRDGGVAEDATLAGVSSAIKSMAKQLGLAEPTLSIR